MRIPCVFAALAAIFVPTGAQASVVARVDISTQTMSVQVDGRPAYTWPVSTARKGYLTPTGSYRPIRMHRMWHSRKYDWSPMPHAIFFRKGWAVHGTGSVRQLGRPASHGCIRLHPAHAAALYALVQAEGPAQTRIVITR